jgi:hypothetical protein
MKKIMSEGTVYWINEDNIEFVAEMRTDYAVRFVSGTVMRVDEQTAKDLIGGYDAKKRKDVQSRSKAVKVRE